MMDETMDEHREDDEQEDEVCDSPAPRSEREMEEFLDELLHHWADSNGQKIRVSTFDESGLLTRNKGIVVHVDGRCFQLTIVQDRR